jgi:hypothetical protein
MSKNPPQPDPMREWRYLLENTLLSKEYFVNFGDQPQNLTDALYHLSWSLRELARAIMVAQTTPPEPKNQKQAKAQKGEQEFRQPSRPRRIKLPETSDEQLDFS